MPSQRIPRTTAHAGIDARLLAERLFRMQKDELVTYAELSALIGKDVQKHRYLLSTARNLVRMEYGMVFDVETNVGLLCLTSAGIVGLTDGKLRRQYRAAGRIQRDLACVDPAALSAVERYRWMAQQSITMSVGLFTHPKTLSHHIETQTVPQLPFNPDDYRDLFQ